MEQLRKLLNVPDELRIAQHIYNSNRDTEVKFQFNVSGNGKTTDIQGVGVDIFNIEDEEFIRKCKDNNYE